MLILERSEIIEAFHEWDKQGIPELVAAYSGIHEYLIARAFTFVKEPRNVTHKGMEYTFPIAKVLQVGDGWTKKGCEVGGYVRLRDIDAMAYPNARYEVWVRNQYQNAVDTGLTSKIGNSEPRMVMNLWKNLGNRLFNPDPFDHTSEGWMSNIFFLDEGNVLMPIGGIEDLLEGRLFGDKAGKVSL